MYGRILEVEFICIVYLLHELYFIDMISLDFRGLKVSGVIVFKYYEIIYPADISAFF